MVHSSTIVSQSYRMKSQGETLMPLAGRKDFFSFASFDLLVPGHLLSVSPRAGRFGGKLKVERTNSEPRTSGGILLTPAFANTGREKP